jgi:hypothetical protein
VIFNFNMSLRSVVHEALNLSPFVAENRNHADDEITADVAISPLSVPLSDLGKPGDYAAL